MRFKKVALLSGLTLLAGSMVVPAGSSVNRRTTAKSTTQTDVADGMPLPPHGKSVLSADGMPLPPLPPGNGALLADGMPLPPLPPSAPA
jgi:hypothetical protein